jgi:hypothetical protein
MIEPMGSRPPTTEGLVAEVVDDEGAAIERTVIAPIDEARERRARRESPTQPLRPIAPAAPDKPTP